MSALRLPVPHHPQSHDGECLAASDIGVHPRRINEIAHGNRTITADTALRLSRYFGLSERFWLNLQARYDLEVEKDRLEDRLEKEVKVFAGSPALHTHG
jgi:antitoxin HigA-1